MCDNKVVPDMTGARPDSTISLVRFDPAKEMQVLRVRWTCFQSHFLFNEFHFMLYVDL